MVPRDKLGTHNLINIYAMGINKASSFDFSCDISIHSNILDTLIGKCMYTAIRIILTYLRTLRALYVIDV